MTNRMKGIAWSLKGLRGADGLIGERRGEVWSGEREQKEREKSREKNLDESERPVRPSLIL